MGSRRVRRRSAAAIAFLLGLFWIVCVDVNNDPESATEGVEEHSVSSRGLMRFCDLHQRHMERFDPEDYRALWETSLLPADDVEVRFQKASAKSRPSGKRVAIVHVRGDHFHAWLLRVWPRVKSALVLVTGDSDVAFPREAFRHTKGVCPLYAGRWLEECRFLIAVKPHARRDQDDNLPEGSQAGPLVHPEP